MYFFDIEDLYNAGVCGANMTKTTPIQWEEVFTIFRAIIDVNSQKFNQYYLSATESLPASKCKTQIASLYNNWENYATQGGTLRQKLSELETSLKDGTFDECGHSQWKGYMDAYNTYLELQKRIVFLIDTNCEVQAYDFDTCVDVTTISDEKPVTTKCCGIYMKRVDIGSEFIGTVTDSNQTNNSINGNYRIEST